MEGCDASTLRARAVYSGNRPGWLLTVLGRITSQHDKPESLRRARHRTSGRRRDRPSASGFPIPRSTDFASAPCRRARCRGITRRCSTWWCWIEARGGRRHGARPPPARRVRDTDPHAHGRSDEADSVRVMELGADDYLTKPFSRASCWRASAPFCGGAARKCARGGPTDTRVRFDGGTEPEHRRLTHARAHWRFPTGSSACGGDAGGADRILSRDSCRSIPAAQRRGLSRSMTGRYEVAPQRSRRGAARKSDQRGAG